MKLPAARVVGETIFCSFRNPLSQRVQETLPLPPKTTLVGLLGAAMGIGFDDLPPLYDAVRVGVRGWHGGETWDLRTIWKLEAPRGEKAKGIERVRVGGAEAFRSLISRQHHYRSKFLVYYASEEIRPDEMVDAFRDPRYALTMGMSDELFRVRDVRKVELSAHKKGRFSNTVLPGDPETLKLRPATDEFQPPVRAEVPVGFEIRKGRRVPKEKRILTFLTEGEFEAEIPCHLDEEHGFVALY